MARARNDAAGLDAMVGQVGRMLGAQLAAAAGAALNQVLLSTDFTAAGSPARRGPGRPPRNIADSEGSGCAVPSCGKRVAAKGLCATHYAKSRRLRLGGQPTPEQLQLLAEDGRATRHAKG